MTAPWEIQKKGKDTQNRKIVQCQNQHLQPKTNDKCLKGSHIVRVFKRKYKMLCMESIEKKVVLCENVEKLVMYGKVGYKKVEKYRPYKSCHWL